MTKLLVFGRILDPASKRKIFENRDKFLFQVVDSNDINQIFRTLDVLSGNSKKYKIEWIQKLKIHQLVKTLL